LIDAWSKRNLIANRESAVSDLSHLLPRIAYVELWLASEHPDGEAMLRTSVFNDRLHKGGLDQELLACETIEL
jgi:hypothetical protein